MKKILFIMAFLLLIISCNKKEPEKKTEEKPIETQATQEDKENLEKAIEEKKNRILNITAVGDIMLGSNYPNSGSLPKNNGNILKDVEEYLKNSDITFGNLEGTLFDEGGSPKNCSNPSVCYVFRTPSIYGQYLAEAGFDIVSLANNHNGDFGPTGRKKTKENLDKLGIKYAGLLETDESVILEKDGIKYGFAAFAPNNGTVSIHDLEKAKQIVKHLKENSDIVIISFHGGAEGESFQHVPKKEETFHGENRGNVYKFAHEMVDAGADVVFGHGPHVTRAFEVYNNKFIAYSMGNFATYGNFSLSGSKGIAPIITININGNGDFLTGKVISTYQTKGSGPKIDPKNRALTKIIDLTKADFPETKLIISEDGNMKKAE